MLGTCHADFVRQGQESDKAGHGPPFRQPAEQADPVSLRDDPRYSAGAASCSGVVDPGMDFLFLQSNMRMRRMEAMNFVDGWHTGFRGIGMTR